MRCHPPPKPVTSVTACLSAIGTTITKSPTPTSFTWKRRAAIVTSYVRNRTAPLTIVKRLAEFEEFLPEHLFVRVHRSHVVSLRAVTKFVGNTVWLGDLSLPIGEKYRDGFLSRLDIL